MLEVRPATMEDKEAVLAFCRETFDWGDYIEHVYDSWVNDPEGQMAVAILEGKPVGISHVKYLSDSEAWFEGLRVDPDYRRHGVAKALTNYTRESCLVRGITVGRALIEGSNVASQALSAKAGFRQVRVFKAYKHAAEPVKREVLEEVRRVVAEDMEQVADFMQGYAGRMITWQWHAQEVSATALARALRDEALYMVKRDGEIVCVAAVGYWEEDKDLDVVSYFCATEEDLRPLVQHFVNEQVEGRVAEFHVFETDEQHVADLAALGFESSASAVSGLWELRL